MSELIERVEITRHAESMHGYGIGGCISYVMSFPKDQRDLPLQGALKCWPNESDTLRKEIRWAEELEKSRSEGLPEPASTQETPRKVTHDCAWPDCKRRIGKNFYMCLRHWNALPEKARKGINMTYRPAASQQSKEFQEVNDRIARWIHKQTNRE